MNEDPELDELTCPITYQLFRDPVKAPDGHVYERQAISTWILLHGTSPFTRQPLQINDLIPDDRLKTLADKKRKGSVSYNVSDDRVILPPLEHARQVNLQMVNPVRINIEGTHLSKKIFMLIILISLIFPLCFILGITLGLKNSYLKGMDITSTYSNTLSNVQTNFNRSDGIYYYKTISITISTDGFYGFEIIGTNSISVDGNLYYNTFDDNNLSNNLINYAYKDNLYSETVLGNSIQSQQYILLITTYFCCNQPAFSVSVTGPNYVLFS